MTHAILIAVSLLAAGDRLSAVADDEKLSALCHVHVVPARSDSPMRLIVHIRDWHFVAREDYAADLRDQNPDVTEEHIDEAYGKSVARTVAVQKEQEAALRHLVQRHNVGQVFLEGLTDRDVPVLDIIVRALRQTRQREGETWLRVGAAGHLLIDGDLKRVLPAERQDAYEAANPVNEGKVAFDTDAIDRRRKAIVERLEREAFAVVVLGASHDLSRFVSEDTAYIQLTVPQIRRMEQR